jgi:tetratricopeptide (TPR) repeat protein
MERWRLSHGVVGVNAPSWLTFEVHRPYFDGADSPLTEIQARAPLLAARRFEQREPTALRFGMNMPASYRRLLVEESRLHAYRAAVPTDLPTALASPAWASLARAYAGRERLDRIDRAALAHWLVAVCLPGAVLELVPEDLDADRCRDEVDATTQAARATALFQAEGLSARTAAAYRPLVTDPGRTLCHVQAVAAWGYLLARHAGDGSAAPDLARHARTLLDQAADGLTEFACAVVAARLDLREAMHAERAQDFAGAARRLRSAADAVARLKPVTPEDELVLLESRRRLIDRRLDIAVRQGDRESEQQLLAEGIALDPYSVKIRMQAAQAQHRLGRHDRALAGYLHAARLGPHGTGFALLNAAECARLAGHEEFARVLAERAFRAAPRSARTAELLAETCARAGDEPLAEVARRAARRDPDRPYQGNWHFQMYASYFNLGESRSPNLYASLPTLAYQYAAAGALPEITWQRLMPPAFRTNLVRESGLAEFDVAHPAELPQRLRTPAWEQLCEWTGSFAADDPVRQLLTSSVLFRLGFGRVVLDLVPERTVAELSGADELRLHHWRDLVRYVGSVGGPTAAAPTTSFQIAGHPDCPLRLRFVIAVFAVVFHARETKELGEALAWRTVAEAALAELLADPACTPLDRLMLESRFYRSATYVPFLQRDQARLGAEMERAERLAREVRAATPYEEFLRRENLRACLESRSKEALAFGHDELAHARIEEVIAIDPYEPKSHIELAESLVRQGREREAADAYLRAARLGPTSTASSYGLAGECLDRAGLPELAEDCFIQSLRIDPYAVSSARGWARTGADDAMGALGRDYLDGLQRWAAERQAARLARQAG